MKTQADCWKALLDGKTLEDENFNIVRLENGCQVDENDKVYNTDGFRFCHPSEWKIQRKHFDIKKAVELLGKDDSLKITRESHEYWEDTHLRIDKNGFVKNWLDSLTKDDILATDYYIIEEGNND